MKNPEPNSAETVVISRKPRTIRFGKDLRRFPNPTLLPRRGHLLEKVKQECVQRERLHALPGQPFQCSATLNVKKLFMLRWHFSGFSSLLNGTNSVPQRLFIK